MSFRTYATRADAELDLLEGAVHVARLEYPALELRKVSQALDELAEPLKRLDLPRRSVSIQADALAEHLHGSCGFRGNLTAYHEPENSFVNVVIERRMGIPISLSLVYLEVARRVGVHARGLGFPGHFLVRIDDPRDTVVIDPFFAGEQLDRAGLERLLERIAPRLPFSDQMLQPVTTRQMLTRMLMNLRAIYASRAEPGRLLVVLDHLIDLMPEALDEVRERGLLYAKLGASEAAIGDLRRYLESSPYAGDASDVSAIVERLQSSSGKAN